MRVGVRFFRRQSDQDRDRQRDTRRRQKATHKVDLFHSIQRLYRDDDDHQRQHIEPSGVVVVVQKLKGAVEHGDKRHDDQYDHHSSEKAALLVPHTQDCKGHGEHRNV